MKILVLVIIALIPFQIARTQTVDTSITYRVLTIKGNDSHYFFSLFGLYAEKDTTLIWDKLKSSEIEPFQQEFLKFQEFLQYETHFSNILNNYVACQVAKVDVPTKNKVPKFGGGDYTVFEIQFYYPYQCDKFMQVIDKYKVEEWGYPTEQGGSILFHSEDRSIFVFVDWTDEWDIEKLKGVRDRVKKLLNK
jgi:hypothetical protein